MDYDATVSFDYHSKPRILLHSTLLSTGSFVPEDRQSNRQLEQRLGLADGWIQQRTGIEFRAIADAGDTLSDLAVRAGQSSLANSACGQLGQRSGQQSDSGDVSERAKRISTLILATSTPDHPLPPTSAAVATQLGISGAAAFDLTVACSGFAYALILADSLVRAQGSTVMIIAANILSRRCKPDDPKTTPLFADGAGAIIVGPGEQGGFMQSSAWHSDGEKAASLWIPDGGSKSPFNEQSFANQSHLMELNDGSAVFRYAVENMAAMGLQAVEQSEFCLLYTSPSPRDQRGSRMPSSA